MADQPTDENAKTEQLIARFQEVKRGGGRRKRRRGIGRFRHKFVLTSYVAIGCLLMASAVFFNMHDSALRRPATEDGPGDPATMYSFWALAAAIGGIAVFIAAFRMRRKRTGGK